MASAHGPYGTPLLLVNDSYDRLPKKQHNVNEGTIPPIPKDFASPWVGQIMHELVGWLKAKPTDIDLNHRHFAVLDAGARDDPPTVVVCRWGDMHGSGEKLFMLRKPAMKAVEHLLGAPADVWDETIRIHGGAEIRYDGNETDT